ncbi:unnamed protein product, partial [Allacma fusca]
MRNAVSNALASIKSINNKIDLGELLVIRHATRKMDQLILERFHQSLDDTEVPPLQKLLDFLDKEMRVLDAATTATSTPSSNHRLNGPTKTYQTHTKSEKFTKRTCNQKHHSLLHTSLSKGVSKPVTLTTHTVTDTSVRIKLKPTAIVNVTNQAGAGVSCRTLIANCSDACFIQESLVRELGLPKEKLRQKQVFEALQNKPVTTATEFVNLEVTSRYHPQVQFSVKAFVIQKLGRFLQEPIQYPQPNRVSTKPRLTPQQEEKCQAKLRPLQQQVFLTATIDTNFPSVIEIAARYSNWNRLRRHVCWWIRLWRHYVQPCQQQPAQLQISPNELRHAENLL